VTRPAVVVAPPADRPCPSCAVSERRVAEVVEAARQEIEAERRERVKRGREAAALRLRLREALVALADVVETANRHEEAAASLRWRVEQLERRLAEWRDLANRATNAVVAAERAYDQLASHSTVTVPDRRS
jgi:hypothetical protein